MLVRSLHSLLWEAYDCWTETKDDPALLASVLTMTEQFGKERSANSQVKRLSRDALELICFEHVTG
jgi:hypothetical protein